MQLGSTRPSADLPARLTGAAGHDTTSAREGLIVMRLRAVDQLFDQVDPSPFGRQDLSEWAAEYIVESVKEMRVPQPSELVIAITEACDPGKVSVIGEAVRAFFARQAMLRQRSLRRLLRRGLTTLAIGVLFLVAFFGLSQLIGWLLGDGPAPTLLREGLLIVGWVAMWRPIEIFLYDWWPIVGQRRLYSRLSRLEVSIASAHLAASEENPLNVAVGVASSAAARAIERWENEGGRTRPRDQGAVAPLPPIPPTHPSGG